MSATNKPDILVVTRNLPPLVGGMERLIWHVIDELRQDYKVHVVGPVGCKNRLPRDVKVIEVQLRPMVIFLFCAFICALWSAIRWRPTIILAGSGLTAPIAWITARLLQARCMVYLHGLDVCAKHPVYRLIWVPFFRLFNAVIVNSHYTKQLAINAKVPSNRISILHPGVEIPDIGDANTRSFDFRARRNLGEAPILLYVGRITPRKGLLCFVKNILPHILKEAADAVLVVIGDDPVDALQSSSNERTRVNAVINENGLKSKVHFLGICSDEELDNAYFAADILIFPVQQSAHDIEGFGMVAIEAAAHGLPTVAFSVGGVSDAVSDGSSGNLISPDENLSFAQAVIRHIKKEAKSQPKDDCRKFAVLFRWNEFGGRLRNIFRNVGQKGC